jgi:hypothetical protein
MPDRFETIDTARADLLADGLPDKARVIAATWNKAAGNPLCAQFGSFKSRRRITGRKGHFKRLV